MRSEKTLITSHDQSDNGACQGTESTVLVSLPFPWGRMRLNSPAQWRTVHPLLHLQLRLLPERPLARLDRLARTIPRVEGAFEHLDRVRVL